MDKDTNNFNSEQDRLRSFVPDYSDQQQAYDDFDYRVTFGRRLGAYLLDILFLMLISSIIFMTFLFSEFDLEEFAQMTNFEETIRVMSEKIMVYTTILSLVYHLPEIFIGGTFGKMILKIRIGSDDRTKANPQVLLIRYLLKNIGTVLTFISILTAITMINYIGTVFSIIIIIGCFFVLNYRRQAFHDMIAKTAVYFTSDFKENYSESNTYGANQ